MRKVLSNHVVLLMVVSLAATASLGSIFQSGMFTGHDIWHNVARLHHFSEAINSGQLMPTWVAPLANGYGYPLFYFSYHFPWLVAMPFLWSGLSVFETLKVVFFLGYLLAGFSMYYSVYLLTKSKTASLGAALIYLISPHHFFSVFVSASIGTVFQFIFIPLIFSLLTVLSFTEQRTRYAVLLALVSAASILSHFMSFVFVVPFLLLYGTFVLLQTWRQTRTLPVSFLTSTLIAGLLAFGLVAYYLVPMFQLLPYITATGNDAFTNIYQNHYANFSQLIYSTWGFGPIISNAKDGEVSLQVGVVQWASVLAGILVVCLLLLKRFFSARFKMFVASWIKIPANIHGSTIAGTVALFALTIFLMTDASKPIWELAVQHIALDYPFRYLLLSVFFASWLFGFVVSSLRSLNFRLIVVLGSFLLAWYTNRNHMSPNMFADFSFQTYIDSETTTNTFHEYLPRTADGKYLSKPEPIATTSAELRIESLELTPRGLVVAVTKDSMGEIPLHQYNFPGQQVYINDEPVKHGQTEDGLISVTVPKGDSIVKTIYEPPGYVSVSLLFSALTLAYCIKVLISKETKTL